MKKILLTLAAALALVSCSQEDLMTGFENRPTGAISAKAFVPTVTRGTALNEVGDLVEAENGFDLYAFLNDDNKTQFMGNANGDGVAFQGSGSEGTYVWDYVNEAEMRFWSEANGAAIKFFAVSPMNEKTTSLGDDGSLTKTISYASQTLDYTVPTTCSGQVDLMYAVTEEYASDDETATWVKDGIDLQFRHALSQIVFKAKTESGLIYADVADVKIKNVYQTGSFDVATAETYRTADDKSAATFPWTGYAELKEFTAQLGGTTPTNINTTVDEEGDETTTSQEGTGNYTDGRLTDSSEALLLIPQNLESNNAVLLITCSVRYKRGEGDEPTIVDNQTIEIPVTTNWQPGYKYTYTLIFTAEMGNPIKVQTVGVDEWNDAGNTDVIVDGENESKKELVYNDDGDFTGFKIQNANDLVMMRDLVNSGATYDIENGQVITKTDGSGANSYASASYVQTGIVDLSTVCGSGLGNWEPIGSVENNFMGSYNGKGYEIRNLYVNDNDSEKDYALFGALQYAYLTNITVSGEINSGDEAAAIAYLADETASIMNCVSSVNVTATDIASGIVVIVQGNSTIQGCINKGTITANYASGIANTLSSNSDNNVKACYNIGTINGGDQTSGIICGANLGNIKVCYNSGQLSGSTNGIVAGIIGVAYPQDGNNYLNIDRCYYTNAEKGIGSNLSASGIDETVMIEGDVTWSVAATEMNKSMSDNLKYSDYTGNDNEPLTFVTE